VAIVIYIISGLFILLAIGLIFAYYRTKHYGLMVMAFAYGAGAGLALTIMHWWPLAAGFVLVWLLRFLGLDPWHDGSER